MEELHDFKLTTTDNLFIEWYLQDFFQPKNLSYLKVLLNTSNEHKPSVLNR